MPHQSGNNEFLCLLKLYILLHFTSPFYRKYILCPLSNLYSGTSLIQFYVIFSSIKYQKGCVKHKQLSSLFLTDADCPRSMWSINPYCAHISPGASSIDISSIMIHAELLVCLVLHMCISKVLYLPAPPLVVGMYGENTM